MDPIAEATLPTLPKKMVPVVSPRGVEQVPDDEVDYRIPYGRHQFTAASNTLPMPQSMKGARFTISAKYATQALPMKEAEAPLVDTLDEDTGEGVNTVLGKRLGMVFSPHEGTVTNISPTGIDLKTPGGKKTIELHDFFPGGRKTYTTDKPLVKIGDTIQIGQQVARSNYVTDDGTLAIGKNLRVAFMAGPHGGTFEDSITLSQDAANKLTSTHLYGYDADTGDGTILSKSKFAALFSNRYTKAQLDKFGPDGLPIKGAVLEPGDPIILAVSKRSMSSKDAAMGNVGKLLRNSWMDRSQVWHKATPGTVADSQMNKGGAVVNVASEAPLKTGDKLSARQGAKGVVGAIINSDLMPRGEDGKPIDIFINTAALIGRVNPAMVFEAMLGKVARKTGKRVIVPQFTAESSRDLAERMLGENGLSATETITDPVSGRSIPGILTGHQYFMKLEHVSSDKVSGRAEGGVDINDQPSRNDQAADSSKRLGGLMNTALASAGATEVLRDAKVYRGTGNPDLWRRIRAGLPLPAPQIPFIYTKYLNSLRAAGINVRERRDSVSISAMTDKEVDNLKPVEVNDSSTIDPDSGEPVKGGLFDYSMFGGTDQKGWGVIKLDDPVPNPLMEESVRAVLGLTEKGMREIIAGKGQIGGHTGPVALKAALERIDLKSLEKDFMDRIRNGTRSGRDAAIKGLSAVRGLVKSGMEPADMLITKVPVIPPAFRPATIMDGVMLVSDANYLYKDLLEARNSHRLNKQDLPEEELGDEKLAIYDALKAVQGFGDPIHPEHKAKGVKGFVRQITGSGGPKTGLFQSKVLGHPVNTVGRSVIIPDSRLDMDHVGIPEKMAWRMYSPFVIGRMVKDGMKSTIAATEVENKSKTAKRYLLDEMGDRDVMYSRDPALHRFSIMGGRPVLVPGDSIRISPLVVGPFNADFDGDQMNVHVPISREAMKEVRETMMPSQNLLSIRNRQIHYKPSQEFILGLYNITSPKGGEPVRFSSVAQARAAYARGEIAIDTPVEIGGDAASMLK